MINLMCLLSCFFIGFYFVDMFRWEIGDFLKNSYAYTIYTANYKTCDCGKQTFIFIEIWKELNEHTNIQRTFR